MSILLNNAPFDNAPWKKYLNEYLPELPVWIYPDIPDPETVEYACVWDHPYGDLMRYPNLKAILNLGAGMDLIDRQPELPDVPIVRLVDPEVGTDMAHFCLYWVLHFQRNFETYRTLSATQTWQRVGYKNAANYTVVVLGLGMIGGFIAQTIARNQFRVIGWSRSQKSIDGVVCVAGEGALMGALKEADVVINALPLNKNTAGFLNAAKWKALKPNTHFINVSRGGVVDDAALLDALEQEQVGMAALDVFATEPLPSDSVYWHHPRVFITPHMSGPTYARSACRTLADNIERMELGKAPFPIYIPENA